MNLKTLTELNIKTFNKIQNYTILKFEEVKSEHFILHILLDDFMDTILLQEILEEMKNSNFKINFKISIKNPKIKSLILNNYIKFIISHYHNYFKSIYFTKILDYKNISFKNNMLIFSTQIKNSDIESDFKFLYNRLKNLGINITFKIKYEPIDLISKNNNTSDFQVVKKSDELSVKTIKELRKNQVEFLNKICLIEAKVFDINIIVSKKAKTWHIYSVYLTDYTESIILKLLSPFPISQIENLKVNDWIRVKAKFKFDNFSQDNTLSIFAQNINQNLNLIKSKDVKRFDNAKEKRIELHTHTKMSTMDGIVSASQYIKEAYEFGHSAIAITDLNNIQAFPEAHNYLLKNLKGKDFKIIYGLEATLIDKSSNIVYNSKNKVLLNQKYVVFDLETTGLSPEYNEIIEFGAVIIDSSNNLLDKIDLFIKPSKPITDFTTTLTGITNEMLNSKGIEIRIALEKIKAFISDYTLVAHNGIFDLSFLNSWMNKVGLSNLQNTCIDTLPISRILWPNYKNHRLGSLAKKQDIRYDEIIAHRADYDADVLSKLFIIILNKLKDISTDTELSHLTNKIIYEKKFGNHAIILAKNNTGLINLFKLVSISHTESFYLSPKLFKEHLEKNREGLLIGASGCYQGEIFENAMYRSDDVFQKSFSFYDYIEIHPLANYSHLVLKGIITEANLILTINRIIKTAKKLNILLIASSDCRYLDKNDYSSHEVFIYSKRKGGKRHPLFDYKNRIDKYPVYNFRNTTEMLEEFSFLNNPNLANALVINNPKILIKNIPQLYPLKNKLYTPVIEDSSSNLKSLCYKNAREIYGKDLPEIVKKRLNKELNSIIKYGFSVVYWISHLLVKKSRDDGYLVGSRGSVGSSLVATLANITEVNPLPPHYICTQCKFYRFINDKNIRSGFDLPNTECLNCGSMLKGEGHNIPFETFLGFEGNKVPDIDLNFSGDYQAIAHNFTKSIFGDMHVFRAGTISTVASKTAFGYVKAYIEAKYNDLALSYAEINRLSKKCEGVKRTTGQHPGGIVVIPKEYDVNFFTPINYPADDLNSSWKTTHFDFHAIHDNVLKLDILGHDDPTALKLLEKFTNIDPITIPMYDEKVMSLFTSVKELKFLDLDISNEKNGAVGLPEFGTKFVRQMLEDTKPQSFADLVQISGLSHGTNVWLGNAKELINNSEIKLSDLIGCRDDIMLNLISEGLNIEDAFVIMESVRKGKGLTQEQELLMHNHKIKDWYIESCKKIKYMFPKAHAVAYVIMAWRIAWYKLYYPYEYYATFFSTRASVFDIINIVQGSKHLKKTIKELEKSIANKEKITQREKDLLPIYEVACEMWNRGIEITNVSLEKSDSKLFIVTTIDNKKVIIPPFTTIDGLGESVAENIILERSKCPNNQFNSIADLQQKTKMNKNHINFLRKYNIIDSLPEQNQMDIFNI